MLLSRLSEPLSDKNRIGSGDPDITDLVYDSRQVVPGVLFACIRGDNFDGHKFIEAAITKGAGALLIDDLRSIDGKKLTVPAILVSDTREALPILANSFFHYPSRKLKFIGVTGTKGKTTTAYLIEGALRRAGLAAGVIGTLGARANGKEIHLDRTTPEAVDLQRILAGMVDSGVQAAAMEISSHALAKRRTLGCEYDVGVFTNLTHDHLDFHNTLDEYLEAKLTLFREYPRESSKPFTAVVNIDDPRSGKVLDAVAGKMVTYGIKNPADIRAENIAAGATNVTFDAVCPQGKLHIDLNLGGMFNVYNALAAVGAVLSLGYDLDEIGTGLESVRAVDGRFESVDCGQDFAVIVDYAHSPDSLDNVMKSARELTTGRMIVVFGCGGDRDTMKRSVMGKLAAEQADVCIVTSDNPRTEDPEAIIQEILTGTKEGNAKVEAITDRRDAIKHALEIAKAGDLVVIAGKGHETYQIFKNETIHFDDREVVREILGNG